MPAVKGEILALVEEHRPATLDLYMANIRLLSSNALSMLLALNRKLQSAGCHLNLHGVNPTIRELLDVTHLSRVLDVR